MAAEKTMAIVIRVVEFSESSCVVTLMTEDFGKITVMAKGARRRKSPFQGALDLLSITRIVFLHKSNDSLDLLTEAKLERRFRGASLSLDRLYAGYYVAELLAAMTDEADRNREVYELARTTLEEIENGCELATLLTRFELGSLILLGHSPMLDQCVDCGRPRQQENRSVNFGWNHGGVLCPRCRTGKKGVVKLSAQTWSRLVRLSKLESTEKSQCDRTADSVSQSHDGELRQFMKKYVSHHLGYRPKLHQYLHGEE